MFLAKHPLVDVVAHPWDSISLAAGDWFLHRDKAADWSIYNEIPQEMCETLGRAILENGKLAEINLPCVLKVPDFVTRFYMESFRNWRDAGVKFTIGSDQHSAHPDAELFAKMETLLDEYGFTENDFALPFDIK
jgi:histidinol phosphatase-like PHP family hydrolase